MKYNYIIDEIYIFEFKLILSMKFIILSMKLIFLNTNLCYQWILMPKIKKKKSHLLT